MNDLATISVPENPTEDMFGFNEAGYPAYAEMRRILETYGYKCDYDGRKRNWGFTFSPDRRLVTFSWGHNCENDLFARPRNIYKECILELWRQLRDHQFIIERWRTEHKPYRVVLSCRYFMFPGREYEFDRILQEIRSAYDLEDFEVVSMTPEEEA